MTKNDLDMLGHGRTVSRPFRRIRCFSFSIHRTLVDDSQCLTVQARTVRGLESEDSPGSPERPNYFGVFKKILQEMATRRKAD